MGEGSGSGERALDAEFFSVEAGRGIVRSEAVTGRGAGEAPRS